MDEKSDDKGRLEGGSLRLEESLTGEELQGCAGEKGPSGRVPRAGTSYLRYFVVNRAAPGTASFNGASTGLSSGAWGMTGRSR
jgi:hypothetical protein